MKGKLFKIKEGKIETWKSWGNLLSTQYKDEAIETLIEEGLTQEGFILFEIEQQFYTIGFSEGKDLPATDRELNRKHKEIFKECLEPLAPVSFVYYLKNEK